ncbi:unnamed protein product [Cochlearia groenlandica]
MDVVDHLKDYCYDSNSDDPYAGDHFRMYEFKIRRCNRSRSHDWTDCPFSHPGEKARRRDPLLYNYTGEVCPEFRHGGDCTRGDQCGFSHGVFECWLHPSRYRTEPCKDGKHCNRKICFFAHSPRQLRVLSPSPENFISGVSDSLSPGNNRCGMFCSHSPKSTLLGLTGSPSSSPPFSPANKEAAFSRLSRRHSAVSYNEVLNELISSSDSFNVTEELAAAAFTLFPVILPNPKAAAILASPNLSKYNHHRLLPPWLDVGVFSPSTTSPTYFNSQLPPPPSSFFSDEFTPRGGRLSDFAAAATVAADNSELDLGWVNDLLT